MPAQAFSLHKRHPLIGVEIQGVDLSQPMSDELLDQITTAWLENPGLIRLASFALHLRSSVNSLKACRYAAFGVYGLRLKCKAE